MRILYDNIILSSGRFVNLNFVEHSRVFYTIEHLNGKIKKSRGGNSSVFKLIDPNTEREYAIKFCKYAVEDNITENFRFEREVSALYIAKERKFENVIEIMFDGQKRIDGKTYGYYVMEKADADLRDFVINNEIAVSQKIVLCYELIKAIKELHSIDLYHRDIKPDNIFFIKKGEKGVLKIGDLGLAKFRLEDLRKEEFQKKIGPVGWLSPEVMNKVLCEGTKYEHINDCTIDDMSDIFQLGKVLWFIFKFNVPIGQIHYADFKIENERLFNTIINMIQFPKNRRQNLAFYDSEFLQMAS
jgi:serine/threonine protein kinase